MYATCFVEAGGIYPDRGPANCSGESLDPFVLFSWNTASQHQSAPAHGQDLESARPRTRIMQFPDNARNIKQQEVQDRERTQERSRQVLLSPNNNYRPRCNKDYPEETRQNRPPGNPRRPQPCRVTPKNKMLNPESHKRQRKEILSEPQEWIGLLALFQRSGARENPGAAAHCQSHQAAGPLVPIARFPYDPRDVQQQHKKKKHHSQHRCRWPRQHSCEDSGSRRHERHAHKVRPEQPPGHERRHQRCHAPAINKMLHPEYDQGNSHEDSPECFAHVRHSGCRCCAPTLSVTLCKPQDLSRWMRFQPPFRSFRFAAASMCDWWKSVPF